MKSNAFNLGMPHLWLPPKLLLIMKMIIIIMTTFLMQASATSFGQRVTLSEKNIPLKKVFKEIRNQTGYDFMYDAEIMKSVQPIDVNLKNTNLTEALNNCLDGQNLTFEIKDKSIIIKRKPISTIREEQFPVSGVVLDENGQPIPGASIRIKGLTSRATVSNKDGQFLILPATENDIIVFSYIGYISQEIKVKGAKSPLTIKLKVEENNMKDVVITGTGITRNKNSFTGATVVFSGDQLKAIGNNNIIQSLRTMDPSFLQMENNLVGANPNILPKIEVRGKTSVPTNALRDQFGTDPNQPLFILDGFETTLQTIVDLDMNRVSSVTILKDAASTALYGARASNGVVVVETIKPKAGELQFTYSNDFRVESPLLSEYNMMNATEKLEFERLSGRYISSEGVVNDQLYLDQLYNTHLKSVKEGVDTYWLNEPVRTGFSENNSIYAQGGDEAFRYGVGANYKTQSGAMKGSGRDTWSGSVNLSYRKSKFNINNVLYVRGFSSTESPYGSFANFVNANPYFKKSNDRYLEQTNTADGRKYNISNPLYDAMLPNVNSANNLEVQNNLQLNYDINNDLRLSGGLQMIKGVENKAFFLAPEHSTFEDVTTLKKGRYTGTKLENFSYQANALLTYGKVFNEKHSVTANIRAEINNRENTLLAFTAEGFPAGSTGSPRFAYSYKENSGPSSQSNVYRTANLVGSVNYAYDQRFLFDASYRLDGSTAFGTNEQFSPYWSTGLGWNLHQEKFLTNASWINRLKVYANIGVTGNQNYGNVTSISVYDYNSNTNYNQFGQGLSLTTLGNPNLAPQKTTQISGGVDFSFFNDRLTGYINGYNKYTDPLVVAIESASSTGLLAYPINVGNLNTKGMEAKVAYSPIYKLDEGIIWTIGLTTGLFKSKYDGFLNTLAGLDKQQENNKSLLRFKDGYSPDNIWAVKSMGIDPGTGREMFLTSTGQYSFDYEEAILEAVGNTTPTVEGVISTYFTYKGFNLGVNLRYQLGGDIFNDALYDKVENISYKGVTLNQDKRALYDRWRNPGDIARFKAISQTSTTPMSSRFVQRNNNITGESISLGYTFNQQLWLKSLGMSTLTLTAITNDIFQVSSVVRERGIDYPFANTVSFSLRASF